GDVECKKKLIEVLVALLEPMQARRKQYENDKAELQKVLKQGAERANEIAEQTLKSVKQAMQQLY
nr:tryptophan--tRNA ligase [Gammaproteobacteria bacterium]